MALVAGAPEERARRIALGQVIGFVVLVAVAAAAAALLFEFSAAVVGLLGLVPLAIGLRGLATLVQRRHDGEDEEKPGRGRRRPLRAEQRAVGRSLTAATLITISAGGDNLAVYIPLFRVGGRPTSAPSSPSSSWARPCSPGSSSPGAATRRHGPSCCASGTWPSRCCCAASACWSWWRPGPSPCCDRRDDGEVPDAVDALILDLLEWVGPEPRPYDEVMEAWRTSCPRLPVWEDANARGYLVRQHVPGQGQSDRGLPRRSRSSAPPPLDGLRLRSRDGRAGPDFGRVREPWLTASRQAARAPARTPGGTP